MIYVKIKKELSNISAVEIKGHSGYAEYGKDIVCSAVSAVAQTALLGIIDVSQNKVDYVINDEKGYLKFIVPKAESEREEIKQQAILSAMLLGLRDIVKGYKAFVKLED